MNSKAIIFVQPGEVRYGDVELAEPGSGDLILQTELSGVSVGTERWAYLGRRAEISFPNVPGYMNVGTVVEAGEVARNKGWRPGDRAYFFKSRLAPDWEARSWMGSHTERAVVDVSGPRGNGPLDIHHCERVPEGLPAAEAVLLGLCAVAMRGIEMAGVPAGAKVLVCGLGAIGQYAVQVCRLKGAEVTATDVVEARLQTAAGLGASGVIHGGREKLAAVAAEIAPEGFDIIIDTSSVAAVVNSLFPLLKLRGKFVFQGWYPPPTPLDLNALHQRLPSAYFPCAHRAEAVGAALAWAAQGFLKSEPLITHTFAPSEAEAAYRMIAAGSEEFLGVVFDWRKNS